ncbi:thioester-containing protein 1 allele R1-like [Chironomus tepperi]|uniref:thioester-containing protein 1 allele R1-like n=1 Tax=Chironomus tepperi TaxID=113505 RepID=UPI00391F7BA9
MTLYRNISTTSGTKMHCSTKTLNISPSTGQFHNFIQTDKPIYKPGDVIQYRILSIGKDLKPFHRNSLLVNFTDPYNRVIASFTDQQKQFKGVFESTYTLNAFTVLGDWKITVVVDNKTQYAISKTFTVQKYTLPLFDAVIDIPEEHVLQEDIMTFSVYGKYSFDEFVTGTAEIKMIDPQNGQIFLNTKVDNVKEPHVMNYNLSSLGVRTADAKELEIQLKFTEPESQTSYEQKRRFYAHNSDIFKIKVAHTDKFFPGLPFVTKIYVTDWKGYPVPSHYERIHLTFYFEFENATRGDIEILGTVKDGLFTYEQTIPDEYVALRVTAKFRNSKMFNKNIPKGSVSVGIDSLKVDYLPKEPKMNDNVRIYVTSETPLNNLVVAVVTRFGIVENLLIPCGKQTLCEFELKIDEKMMPKSTIMVYDIRDKDVIYQGKVQIETDNLGRNYLNMTIPTDPVDTTARVKMRFESKPDSKVYLLAFDKRLKSLRDGNDFTQKDVVTSLDYDGENLIMVNDLSDWKLCTRDEIDRVELGRTEIVKQSDNLDIATMLERDDVFPDENQAEETKPADNKPEDTKTDETKPKYVDMAEDQFRREFMDTWIFEKLTVNQDEYVEKVFKPTDSITTWEVSAFSVHEDAGLAIAPTQELVVKNDFFVKLELPYSIRYKEVIKLKVMVFNYVQNKEQVSVVLKLINFNSSSFEFVDYDNCEPNYKEQTGQYASVNLEIPYREAKTAFFYIRSRQTSSVEPKFDENIRIRVEALGTGMNSQKKYTDRLQKFLKVEPIGVKTYSVLSNFHKLEDESDSYIRQTNFSGALSNIDVIVSGDFLTKIINLEKYESFPSSCPEQKSSKLKRYVNTYRYLKSTGKEITNNEAPALYESVLGSLNENYNYKDYPWFRSYLGNILGLAIETEVLPRDLTLMIKSLDLVIKNQKNGTFDNFSFYYDFFAPQDEYDKSIKYFATAYCLVPFLRHREMLGSQYDDFIRDGLEYLKGLDNRFGISSYGLSVAAYVFALNKDRNSSQVLLGELEIFTYRDGNKKCYKISEKDADCLIRHTAFAALALIQLDMLTEAEPVVNWLLSKSYFDGMRMNDDAIITEAVAEMAIKLKTSDTNLNVVVRNERDFRKSVIIKDFNSHIQQNVQLPIDSESAAYKISGTGYCTITMFFEIIVTVPSSVPKFTITINTDVPSPGTNQRIVNVCGRFNDDKFKPKVTIVNVIYEIGMPSGYTFYKIKDKGPEIKHIDTKRGGTLIHLYYNDYYADRDYCVDVIATRDFIVNEAANAGVKIYDYNEKDKVAIEFYRFDSREC